MSMSMSMSISTLVNVASVRNKNDKEQHCSSNSIQTYRHTDIQTYRHTAYSIQTYRHRHTDIDIQTH